MRADERQAAVAYAYAWWMTGDDDVAATALRQALAAPDPAESGDEARLVALVRGIRAALGDVRAMPPASELALLHDGFGVPLAPAAELAMVPARETGIHLAHGRLEALLETVREDFRHPEHLGGLALGTAEDLAHAEDCRSCGRARVLIERGRSELEQVSSVSAPPGLLATLVAEAPTAVQPDAEAVAPTGAPEAQPEAPEADATVEPEVPAETLAVHDIIEGPADYAVAGDDVLTGRDLPDAPDVPDVPEAADEIVLDDADVEITIVDEGPAAPTESAPPLSEEPVDEQVVDLVPPPPAPVEAPTPVQAPPEVPEEPAEDLLPTTPARRRAAGLLAGAGIVTACVLVAVVIGSGGDEDPTTPPATEQPVVNGDPTERARPSQRATDDPFGPPNGERPGFSVTSAGLLLSGTEEVAPSGITVDPQEPLRIAVAYEKANRGVQLRALWRVDDKVFRRLEALVSSRSSRHVWGVPVPEDGWPQGAHRIVITADDSVAGSIDFTVQPPD